MMLKLRHFGQQIRNTLKILEGRAGYLDRSLEEKELHRVKEERNILRTIKRKLRVLDSSLVA